MERSLRIIPKVTNYVDYNVDVMFKISQKLERLNRLVSVVRNAFTKAREGDVNTMSFALISNELRSINKVVTPVYEYMAYFLNLKLQDSANECHYRVAYDPTDYLDDKLLSILYTIVGDRPSDDKTIVVATNTDQAKYREPSGKTFTNKPSKEEKPGEASTKDKA